MREPDAKEIQIPGTENKRQLLKLNTARCQGGRGGV